MQNEGSDMTKSRLEAELGIDGVIYLVAGGRLTNDHVDEFTAWCERVKAMIDAQAARGKSPVLICADATSVICFETKPVMALRTLFDHDKKYTLKTAIVGAKPMTRMMVDAAVSLSGRTNIKQFRLKDEALSWLLESPKVG